MWVAKRIYNQHRLCRLRIGLICYDLSSSLVSRLFRAKNNSKAGVVLREKAAGCEV